MHPVWNFTSTSSDTLNEQRQNHLIDGVLMHPAQNFTSASGGTVGTLQNGYI